MMMRFSILHRTRLRVRRMFAIQRRYFVVVGDSIRDANGIVLDLQLSLTGHVGLSGSFASLLRIRVLL